MGDNMTSHSVDKKKTEVVMDVSLDVVLINISLILGVHFAIKKSRIIMFLNNTGV